MPSSELQNSWNRTIELLQEARLQLSEAAEGVCEDKIGEFEDFLNHNELELALDSLEAAVSKSPGESLRVIELLLAAAENMDLNRHAARYRGKIDRVRHGVEEWWQAQDS